MEGELPKTNDLGGEHNEEKRRTQKLRAYPERLERRRWLDRRLPTRLSDSDLLRAFLHRTLLRQTCDTCSDILEVIESG